MLTIVFYSTDSAAAKLRARQIVAEKPNHARVYDVGVWVESYDQCDAVEIMPDVPQWQRERIMAIYGDKVVDVDQELIEINSLVLDHPLLERKPMGLMPAKGISDTAGQVPEGWNELAAENQKNLDESKKAVHKGGGRWFVMAGEKRLSGPHDKAEAHRLAVAA